MTKNSDGSTIGTFLDGEVRETLTELLSSAKDIKKDGDNSVEYNM